MGKDRPSISIHQAAASVLATFSLTPCKRVYVPSVMSQVTLFPKLPVHCLTACDSRIKCPMSQLLHVQENKLCARENTTAGSEKEQPAQTPNSPELYFLGESVL